MQRDSYASGEVTSLGRDGTLFPDADLHKLTFTIKYEVAIKASVATNTPSASGQRKASLVVFILYTPLVEQLS